MAAFSAVVSLEQLLKQLLNSDQFPKEEVISLHGKISSLKSSFETIFPAPKNVRDEGYILEIETREKIFEAQDRIESFIFAQSHPSESAETSTSFSLQEIAANIDHIVEKAKKLGDSVAEVKKVMRPVDESQTYKLREMHRKIIGQERYKAHIERMLTSVFGSQVILIYGMPGIGKTTLAESIYEDLLFMNNFPYKAWVTVSQDANIQEILGKILQSLESRGLKAGEKKYEGDEGKLRAELHQALNNNKYLVVIDGMWDPEIWASLQKALPDNQNWSQVLITTRISNLVKSDFCLEMQPLGDEDSWALLRNKTFGDDSECPLHLEEYGREIAKHCKGVPVSLTVIGGLLSQGVKNIEYWKSIEEDTYAATCGVKIEDAFSEIFSLIYDLLPCQLKACFLYMTAFRQDSDIPFSKLIMLWVAEGFLTTPPSQLVENVAEQSLLELIDRNLVVIRKTGFDGRIKACGLDSISKDLAEKESGRDMFFHSIKRHPQKVEQGTNNQRRISVHKNILMCLDDVYNSTKTIEKARSLLYVGAQHLHPMPYNLTFDLLRVLDAFTVFFIEFPDEILELIHLRYLSLTYNGKLPSGLSRLHRLQVLIVKRDPNIIYVGSPFLPDEIWNMKELRHLIITETDLPLLPPTEPGSILFENLQTLSNVNATSCTQEVLDNMPNLKTLKMWVEAPGKVELYLSKHEQLEVFKFAVLEPILGEKVEFRPQLLFPNRVRKLCLSGTGLPWEDMEAIAALPNLQVLKLKELAFHGAEWCPTYTFKNLKLLLIEYLDLQKWDAEAYQFPRLEQLIFRHCYDLEELPSEFEDADSLRLIELVECSPDAVKWAEDIIEEVENFGYKNPKVRFYSSWE